MVSIQISVLISRLLQSELPGVIIVKGVGWVSLISSPQLPQDPLVHCHSSSSSFSYSQWLPRMRHPKRAPLHWLAKASHETEAPRRHKRPSGQPQREGAHHHLEPEWGHCDIIPQKIASGPQISPQEDIKRPPKKTTSRGPRGRRNGAGLVNNVINATSQCLRLSLVPWGSGLEVQSSSSW